MIQEVSHTYTHCRSSSDRGQSLVLPNLLWLVINRFSNLSFSIFDLWLSNNSSTLFNCGFKNPTFDCWLCMVFVASTVNLDFSLSCNSTNSEYTCDTPFVVTYIVVAYQWRFFTLSVIVILYSNDKGVHVRRNYNCCKIVSIVLTALIIFCIVTGVCRQSYTIYAG